MDGRIETRCVHGDTSASLNDGNRPISFPIYQTASFSHIEPGHNKSGFDYTRESNPTRQRLQEVVSSLEGAANTVAFTSGMAAISTVFELFSPGDHIICSEDLYGGVFRLHKLINKKNGLVLDYVDTTDPKNIANALTANTKALYIETPSNPTMQVTDIRKCAEIARENSLLLIVDNTFLSPYFQNPLELGADIVIHSGSKFLAGHTDTSSGFVCVKDAELGQRIHLLSKTTGAALSPMDSWLVMRGIKTLAVRMERQQENALELARWLESHPKVTKVIYPGLKNHPGYKTNTAQARGAGSMISFYVNDKATATRVLEKVNLIIFAESLGGTESLITYPLVQTHADVPEETKQRLGINETLLRISVGLENSEDIIADLAQALEDQI